MQSSWFESPESFKSPISPLPDSTPSHTIIRRAKVDDASAIADVITLSFNEFNELTFWMYPLIKIGVAQDLRQRLQSLEEEHIAIVAVNISRRGKEIYQEIVGTVEVSLRQGYHRGKKESYIYIANLAVRETNRRQGIASKLLYQCEEIARQKNCDRLRLHVLLGNEVGQKLYLNNGYRVLRIETDLLSLFMVKKRRLLLDKPL